MIRTNVNPVDFLKSILHVGDFTKQFKSGDSLSILGNWNSPVIFEIDLTAKKDNLL